MFSVIAKCIICRFPTKMLLKVCNKVTVLHSRIKGLVIVQSKSLTVELFVKKIKKEEYFRESNLLCNLVQQK